MFVTRKKFNKAVVGLIQMSAALRAGLDLAEARITKLEDRLAALEANADPLVSVSVDEHGLVGFGLLPPHESSTTTLARRFVSVRDVLGGICAATGVQLTFSRKLQ